MIYLTEPFAKWVCLGSLDVMWASKHDGANFCLHQHFHNTDLPLDQTQQHLEPPTLLQYMQKFKKCKTVSLQHLSSRDTSLLGKTTQEWLEAGYEEPGCVNIWNPFPHSLNGACLECEVHQDPWWSAAREDLTVGKDDPQSTSIITQ